MPGTSSWFGFMKLKHRVLKTVYIISIIQVSKNLFEISLCCFWHFQGKHDTGSNKGIDAIISEAQKLGREFLTTTEEKADFEYYCSLQDLDR